MAWKNIKQRSLNDGLLIQHKALTELDDILKLMELEVIAEGVETEAQLTLLYKYGCKNFQGFLFGCGLPIAPFEATLNHNFIKKISKLS